MGQFTRSHLDDRAGRVVDKRADQCMGTAARAQEMLTTICNTTPLIYLLSHPQFIYSY